MVRMKQLVLSVLVCVATLFPCTCIRLSRDAHSAVPKILHRVWGLAPVDEQKNKWYCSAVVADCRRNFTRSNEDWQEWVWDAPSLNLLIAKLEPRFQAYGIKGFTDVYHGLVHWVERADLARYMLMYAYGGMYLDMDVACGKSLTERVQEGHVMLRLGCKNHILASRPNEDFWLDLIAKITTEAKRPDAYKLSPVRLTGEKTICDVVMNRVDGTMGKQRVDVKFFDPDVIQNTDHLGRDPNPLPVCVHKRRGSWSRTFGIAVKAKKHGDNSKKQTDTSPKAICDLAFAGSINGAQLRVKAALGEAAIVAAAIQPPNELDSKARLMLNIRRADLNSSFVAPIHQDGFRSLPLASDRLAVVNNFAGKKNLAWIKSVMNVEEVGINGPPRTVSEAGPWMQWIVDNYHHLPNYVVFLHGDQISWHAHLKTQHILDSHPEYVEMLANPICRKLTDFYSCLDQCAAEKTLLDQLFPALFGLDVPTAYERFGMDSNRCCAEMVVNADAIRRIDLGIYERLAKAIAASPNAHWGRGLERTWEVLFTQKLRPTEEVEQALDGMIKSTTMHFYNATSKLGSMATSKC